MTFGTTYYKNASGNWVSGKPYFKYGTSGWLAGASILEKQGDDSTWTEIWNGDSTPPPQPGALYSYGDTYYDSINGIWQPVFITPDVSDVNRMCVKMSRVLYPDDPGVDDLYSAHDVQPDGSQFWIWDTYPGQSIQRFNYNMVAGESWKFSEWCEDTSGNWSPVRQGSFTFPYPPTPTKTLTTKSAYITTTDSASFSDWGWRSGHDLLQGGPYSDNGFWFYGTKIRSAIANAYSISSIQIYVQRSSTSHGVYGDANIYIGHHGMTTQPSSSPGTNPITGEYNAAQLTLGEGKWVTLPSSWYSYFKSGTYRGLGLDQGYTSVTSSNYAICYGYGTSSGKLKITWKEYV
jgi:hypothetical protein